MEKNTKVRNWKVVKHVKKEVENCFVPCSSSIPCYLPTLQFLPYIPRLFHLYFTLSFFCPSLKYKTCLLYSLSPLSLHPRVVTHTHTHTNTHIHTFYLIASRMYQYGGSAYPTSTSTARASFSASFPQRSSFSRFFCFFKKEEKWNKNYSLVSFFFQCVRIFKRKWKFCTEMQT